MLPTPSHSWNAVFKIKVFKFSDEIKLIKTQIEFVVREKSFFCCFAPALGGGDSPLCHGVQMGQERQSHSNKREEKRCFRLLSSTAAYSVLSIFPFTSPAGCEIFRVQNPKTFLSLCCRRRFFRTICFNQSKVYSTLRLFASSIALFVFDIGMCFGDEREIEESI